MIQGQWVDERLNRCSHGVSLFLTRDETSKKSETEFGFASQGSLLSVISPSGGRGPRAAMYFRRAMRAAKSSCKRRIEG